jgi:hypothetical protein
MVALLALIAVLRPIYLGQVVSPRLPGDTSADIFNASIAFVRQGAITAIVWAWWWPWPSAGRPSRPAVTRDLARHRRRNVEPT